MAVATTGSPSTTDPDFITFLFNPKLDYDCFILVGNELVAPVEKIGVVPMMLFAHSAVMRTDLQVKNIKDKVSVEIPDILPSTFKNLLRFVYGFDTTSTLSFDDADNLLYAAEKYMISKLKNNVAKRLMSLLNSENICVLLNNPACYQHLELNSSINRILQNETKKVFASPHFLELTSDGLVKILEQEALSVKEIEVWRNAIIWAKNKTKCEDGEKLRKALVKPIKHIRLCTLSPEEFCDEIAPSKVLSLDEISKVCVSLGKKREKQPQLTEICNEVKVRKLSGVKSSVISKTVTLSRLYDYSNDCNFVLETKDSAVELSSLTLAVTAHGENNRYQFNFQISVEEVDNPKTKTLVTFTAHSLYGDVTIPVSTEAKEVLLLANTKYRINISCNYEFNSYASSSPANTDHFSITYGVNSSGRTHPSVKNINYKTVSC